MERRLRRSSHLLRFSAALACAASAVLVRLPLQPWLGSRVPYSTVYIAVLICARYWGAGPAILTMLTGAAGIVAITGERDWTRLFLVGIVGPLSVWIIEILRRAHAKAEQSSRIAEERLHQLREDAANLAREERISAQLRAVVESSGDAIISKDLNGLIQSWNRGAEQVYGYTSAEAIGQNMSMLLPPQRAHEESGITAQIRSGGLVNHLETVRRRKDGKEIHVALTISPVLDGAHKVVGVSHIARDITERRELEEKLRQAQKLESLGVLAGGLAHDFNNLLTGIMGNASLAMQDLGETDPARARMAEILHASERAALLVRQMLAYAGKGRFVIQRVNLSAEVAHILPLVRTSISRLVDLDLHLEPNLPAVEGDLAQIQQLIMNLTINAAEAIGERPGKIGIRTFSRSMGEEQQVVLEVKDTGCGMDLKTQERIFDPFFTSKFTGRGLGLAAVTGIIRAHRGSIDVQSTPGRGSTFTVVLPVVVPAAELVASEFQRSSVPPIM